MVPAVFGLLILMGATMLVIAITSSSLTCFPLSCRSTKTHQDSFDQIASLNLPTVQDLQAHPSTAVEVNFINGCKTFRFVGKLKQKNLFVLLCSFCQSQPICHLTKILLEWEATTRSSGPCFDVFLQDVFLEYNTKFTNSWKFILGLQISPVCYLYQTINVDNVLKDLKMTRGTRKVRSHKKLTLLRFDI